MLFLQCISSAAVKISQGTGNVVVSTVSASEPKLQLEDAVHDPGGGGAETWLCDLLTAWMRWLPK